ncbi:MAG TPA: family 16 glycoside hydrolase [Candidatus Angelobacter sp.]|jgi:hypothetical protein|nr:family 16 glycoside hydrolase [Candidatus Angelobacter sp.]
MDRQPGTKIIVVTLLLCLCMAPNLVHAQPFNLTVAVLVNSSNKAGYNTGMPVGEYQRYVERYFEHLQVPYEIINVATTTPPANLGSRQLIIAAHSGLGLSSAWQTAIQNAVQGGTGFVNLDSAPAANTGQHLLKIFGASGFLNGTPGTSIAVPAALGSGGANTHFIAAMQWKSPLDNPGDFVYPFHADQNGKLNPVTAKILQNTSGTVIAKLGNDPLIVAATFGSGRAVNFGTLDYLQADRFGFMMGIDDLFWRSLVWAARKPFALRGYPRLWALRMDHNVDTSWWTRVQEMYDPALTGNVVADGSPWGVGGPWKVTGSAYLNFIQPGQPGRPQLIADMKAHKLQLSPHSFQSSAFGDLFWSAQPARPLTDAEEQASIKAILDWEGKTTPPISDPLPPEGISKWVLGHFYDISNNFGKDFWDMGFRYIGSTVRPGFQYSFSATDPAFLQERFQVRPYWIYQLPPKPADNDAPSDESYSFFFADDLTVGSRAGQPAQKFFLVGSRAIDRKVGGTPDFTWCNGTGNGVGFAQGKFEWYSWRHFTSLAPVEVYAHDDSFSICAAAPVSPDFPPPPANASLPGGLKKNASQQVIQGVSAWLNKQGTHHVFMQDLAQYAYARTKSVLTRATYDGAKITYTFTGSAADPDANPVPTQLLVFSGLNEGQWQTVPGFKNGFTVSMAPPPPPPVIVSLSLAPASFSLNSAGATQQLTLTATMSDNSKQDVTSNPGTIYKSSNTALATVSNSGLVTAVAAGNVTITGTNSGKSATASVNLNILPVPTVSRVSPTSGATTGGSRMDLYGSNLGPTTTVTIQNRKATFVSSLTDGSRMTVTIPAGTAGPADITATNTNGTHATVSNGYSYLAPAGILFQDSFNTASLSQWTASPLGLFTNWTATNDVADYNGNGHTQIFAGNPAWTDYTVEAKFMVFGSSNFPGGLRGRVNTSTGAAYEAWILPGSSKIILYRTGGWNIDSGGLTDLQEATVSIAPNVFNSLKLSFKGTQISVIYNGATIIRATDSALAKGAIALDVSNQHIQFDDVIVTVP